MKKPKNLNPNDFTTNYINLSETESLTESLIHSQNALEILFRNISEKQGSFRYAQGKWTIKQVLLHIIDVERLFVARALAIARDRNVKIIGFDENLYAANDLSENISLSQLKQDFLLNRKATISFFNTLDLSILDQEVKTNVTLSPRILGWIIPGHTLHHLNVITEKYF